MLPPLSFAPLRLCASQSKKIQTKSVENIASVHRKQIQSYLRLSGKKLGLLLHFGAPLMRDGIVRAVNNLPES